MFKKILFITIAASFGLGISFSFQKIKYIIKQGYGQIAIINNAKNIDELINSTETNDSLKAQLKFIQEVKKFAEDSLMLEKTKNYSTFYDAGKKEINWLVLASYPYKLQAYEWKFPFIGHVPYLGFFNPKDAENEAQMLKSLGFDVRIGHPSAWSTLKVFKDPILSTMLRYSKGRLAEIIIHETTHATFFFKNQMELNENLANFIGKKGAICFLHSKYGKNSQEYLQYKSELRRKVLIAKFLNKSAIRLDSLYKNYKNENNNIKKKQKFRLVRLIQKDFAQLKISEFSKNKAIKDSLLYNNSFYTQFLTYNTKQPILDSLLINNYDKLLINFISDIKIKVKQDIELSVYLNLN